MLEDIRLAHHDLLFEPCQPVDAVAQGAPRVMVRVAIPEGADPHIHARRQHLRWGIIRGRIELDRLKRAAVGKVLRKRTRVRAGVEGQLPDHLYASTKTTLLSTRRVRCGLTAELGARAWTAVPDPGSFTVALGSRHLNHGPHPVVDRALVGVGAR